MGYTPPPKDARPNWLLDTGPLVALLSKRDDAHARCVEVFRAFPGRLLTTEAVLTEAIHLVGERGHAACLDFFLRGGALLIPSSTRRLQHSRELVARYADVPMGYADATLVALADELHLGCIFTLDRDFAVYRWQGIKRFTLVP